MVRHSAMVWQILLEPMRLPVGASRWTQRTLVWETVVDSTPGAGAAGCPIAPPAATSMLAATTNFLKARMDGPSVTQPKSNSPRPLCCLDVFVAGWINWHEPRLARRE